jgi:hypothetical protein
VDAWLKWGRAVADDVGQIDRPDYSTKAASIAIMIMEAVIP